MAPTIKDVAKLAEVSIASVSMVLNNKYKGQVGEESRAKILDAVKSLGYSPHRYGRALKLRKSEIIGYAVALSTRHIFSDPYFHETILVMEKKLRESSHSLLFFALTPRGSGNSLGLNGQASLLDGLVIEAPPLNSSFAAELEQKNVKAVLIGNHPDAQGMYSVDVDNAHAGRRAAEHLLHTGRKNICFISGPLIFANAQDRLKGYREALAEKGIHPDAGLIREGDFSIESGYSAMKEMLGSGEKIDGVVSGNDLMAIGAMNLIKERGLKIPEDIAVCGFNNTSLSQHYEPALTTVNIPARALAEKAIEMLLTILKVNGNGDGNGDGQADCSGPQQNRIILDTELIVRESTVKG